MKVLGFKLSLLRVRHPTLDQVMDLSRLCQGQLIALEQRHDELTRAVEAIRRKVYRDAERAETVPVEDGEIVVPKSKSLYSALTPHGNNQGAQSRRTGDPV